MIEESRLPFHPGGEGRTEGHFRPQVFLYREGEEWRAGWLRPAGGAACCNVTLSFRWWQERAGSRKLYLSLRDVVVADRDPSDADAPPGRLSGGGIDALVVFLGKHWPGVSDVDTLRVWLVLRLRTAGTGRETRTRKRGSGSHVPQGGLTAEQKALLVETAEMLKGHRRRLFMARVVKALGKGGQRRAEAELGWSRGTVRKGMRELEGGFRYPDDYSARGRKRAEEHLPNLLEDIRAVKRALSDRVSAAKVRRRLVARGYRDDDLPCERTIRLKLRQLSLFSAHEQLKSRSQQHRRCADAPFVVKPSCENSTTKGASSTNLPHF